MTTPTDDVAGHESERQGRENDRPTAAERLLRSLYAHGVEYVFANFGTDHTPLLEAAARIRDRGEGDTIPDFLLCPHEFVAMSAAHGFAASTGRPQGVLVHVDVGTQNLGAAMHNAHRAKAPVFVIAGLAPVTHADYPGSRDIHVHYFQDVFDQPGIVREYCRWEGEYRPPTDPAELIARGLQRATATPQGPVYLSATREALETTVDPTRGNPESHTRQVRATGADRETVRTLADRVRAAEAPVVITSDLGTAPGAVDRVDALVTFAETAGAGVVEHAPWTLNFPRDHPLHVGFEPTDVFDHCDLILLADADVPWIPAKGEPPREVPVIQIEPDPTKGTYPQWPFRVDRTVTADAAKTLSAVSAHLDPAEGTSGQSFWSDLAANRRADARERVRERREVGRLTPAVLSAAVDDIVDEGTIVLADAVTSNPSVFEHIELTRPGSFYAKAGAGLGWAGGAAVGVKLAHPDRRVVSLVGDGSYLFAHPSISAWMAAEQDAPTLTVVYDNRGWNAVATATRAEHPEGASVAADVPESHFETAFDLTAPATAVDAYTQRVAEPSSLREALAAGIEAVEAGRPAVLSVSVERPQA